MKTRNAVIAAALVIGLCSSASAQQSGNSSADRKNQQSKNRPMVLTGCLQSEQSSFVLANATVGSDARSDPNATGGSSYKLDGETNELNQHVNHRVEITGRLDSGAGNSSSSGQKLRVESIRMISSSCSGK